MLCFETVQRANLLSSPQTCNPWWRSNGGRITLFLASDCSGLRGKKGSLTMQYLWLSYKLRSVLCDERVYAGHCVM